MARPRRIPDTDTFAMIRALQAETGRRGVTFAAVSARTGLAGASLVQRYGSRDAMVQAALIDGWDRLDRTTDHAIAATPGGAKGAVALLKHLTPSDPALPASDLALLVADQSTPALRARAALWQDRLLQALHAKLGDRGLNRAEMLFALWQGRYLWSATGHATGFRLRDAARLLLAR